MPSFWEYYSLIEKALNVSADEFVKNDGLKKDAIEGIRGLAGLIAELAVRLLKMNVSYDELPMRLASERIIKGSTADELADLMDMAKRVEKIEAEVLYSNLVRFMEVFEEVYFAIQSRLSE